MAVLSQSRLISLPLLARGKVRDIYEVGSDRLLLVTCDRLSAFDVVMHEPIPGKGCVLNAMSLFWMQFFEGLVPNHLTGVEPESVVSPSETAQVAGRSVVVKRLRPLPFEAVVRGYLAGSGYADYQRTGKVCGVPLPAGLLRAQKIPEPIFTPATKAAPGAHDENVPFERLAAQLGEETAKKMRTISLMMYERASLYAQERGILIADTKFEFGLDEQGVLHLIDEVLTPDSSRFWSLDQYVVGESPVSFDKQFVRDYLGKAVLPTVDGRRVKWDKKTPPPPLPAQVIGSTAQRYQEAFDRLVVDVKMGAT